MEFNRIILDEIDSAIRSGHRASARKRLQAFLADHPKGLPRTALTPTASLARRLGLFSLAVRLLHSTVRPSSRAVSQSSATERVEYAGSLLQLGRLEEARSLLAEISRAEEPTADLFSAFGFFSEWNYRASIPLLERYVASPRLTDYQRRIGEVNLAAALVIDRGAEARRRDLLARLLTTAERDGNRLLYGNLLEIAAQDAIYSDDPARAESLLDRAPVRDDLMVRKWRAVLALRHGKSNTGALLRVRQDALRTGQWETVRESDLFLGAYARDLTRLRHVFFGTPYAAYRERIRQFSHQELALEEPSIKLGRGPEGPPLDLRAPEPLGLSPGQVPHRLLLALLDDFYRPPTIASLHAKVFPGSHFNPLTSPQQVHQAMKRLRLRLACLRIVERNGLYEISLPKRERRRLILPVPSRDIATSSFARALTLDGPFTGKSSDAARIWGVSLRTANRALTRLLSTGLAARTGEGRATVYSIGGASAAGLHWK